MAEEYMNPYDIARLSIAEMNLLEKMRGDSRILGDIVSELRAMIVEKLGGAHYVAKGREERVRKLKENIQEEGFKTLEYLVRTGVGLAFKEIYAEVIAGMISVGEKASDLSLYLEILGPQLPQEISAPVEDLASVVEEQAKRMEDLLASLNINPSSAPKNAAEIERLEERADELYRILVASILRSLSKSPELMIPAKEVVERLEEISDTIWRLSVLLKHVAMHRA